MANLKSSKKDLRRTAKKRVKNQAVRTALKTYAKKARTAVDGDAAASAMQSVQHAFDKAVQNGVIHKNAAARRKSRAAKVANKVGSASGTAAAPAAKAVKKAPAAKKPAAKKAPAKK